MSLFNIRTFSNFQLQMFNAHTVIDWIVFSHYLVLYGNSFMVKMTIM